MRAPSAKRLDQKPIGTIVEPAVRLERLDHRAERIEVGRDRASRAVAPCRAATARIAPRRVSLYSMPSSSRISQTSRTTASVMPDGLGVSSRRFSVLSRNSLSIIVSCPSAVALAAGLRKQQVDETFDRRLRLVVGEPGPLVGLDHRIVVAVDRRHHQIEADHRDVEQARRLLGHRAQARVQFGGDVVDRAAGVQVGGLAHRQRLAGGQHAVAVVAGGLDAALGLGVERNRCSRRGWRRRGAGSGARSACAGRSAPSPTTCAGRRVAAATTRWSITTMRRSSPAASSSTITSSQ